MKNNMIYQNETNGAQASTIGYYAVIGREEFLKRYLDNIEKITPWDISKAASEYLDFSRFHISVLEPRNQ